MLLRIATRESPLAIIQALLVSEYLQQAHNNLKFELIKLKTQGDILLKESLSEIGGKGLFIKEIEQAIIDNRADIAVHSMKDIPAVFDDRLEINCILKREDDRDAFISFKHKDFYSMPQGATIGTSSHRRGGQILAMRPDLKVVTIRGNINTRIKKAKAGEVDSIVLAAAGLKRSFLDDYINHYFTKDEMLPAIAQGIIGVQNKKGDSETAAILKSINDESTSIMVTAERAFLKSFNGDCSTPIAANCSICEDKLILRSGYFMNNGKAQFFSIKEGFLNDTKDVGKESAKIIKKQLFDSI